MHSYRTWVEDKDLASFHVKLGESDILIRADQPLYQEAKSSLAYHRRLLEDYIKQDPAFGTSLKPYAIDQQAPAIVQEMSAASLSADVGPMAAVAGAVAEYVGRDLLKQTRQIIVENGGDIFMSTTQARKVGIFAGKSPLTGKLAFEIAPGKSWGICTSSGTVGPSLSFGQADSAVAICKSASLADAWATRLANAVNSAADIDQALGLVKDQPEVKGVIIIVGEQLGVWGEIKLIKS
ncbi:UPF0280 family protein [Candidatus Omnitrophota bacterium]